MRANYVHSQAFSFWPHKKNVGTCSEQKQRREGKEDCHKPQFLKNSRKPKDLSISLLVFHSFQIIMQLRSWKAEGKAMDIKRNRL